MPSKLTVKKATRSYTVALRLTNEEVLAQLQPPGTSDREDVKVKYTFAGYQHPVNVCSHRLWMYATKGLKCVNPVCEEEGAYWHIESSGNSGMHLNLYSASGIMMTKDHIQARALGGPDHVDNYQPLCANCNRNKGANGWKVGDVVVARNDYISKGYTFTKHQQYTLTTENLIFFQINHKHFMTLAHWTNYESKYQANKSESELKGILSSDLLMADFYKLCQIHNANEDKSSMYKSADFWPPHSKVHEWIHNVLVHPSYAILPKKIWNRFHSWHAKKTFTKPKQFGFSSMPSPPLNGVWPTVPKLSTLLTPQIREIFKEPSLGLTSSWLNPKGLPNQAGWASNEEVEQRFLQHHTKYKEILKDQQL